VVISDYITPVMLTDSTGYAPEWWSWALSGVQVALGIVLCATGVGAIIGAGLIVSGSSMLISNTMSALGMDDRLSMQLQSGLNVIAGIGLSFVPGMGALGASMIGAGVLGFGGGYLSEALGGSYGLGWSIGTIVGSIVGGMAYKAIVNKLSTPANMMRSFENHPSRWKLIDQASSQATGRAYRGGISVYSKYQNIWTSGRLGTHSITRLGEVLHYHYFFGF
jgi:hypothetical protein